MIKWATGKKTSHATVPLMDIHYTVGTKYTPYHVYESVLLCVSTEWTVIGRARKRRHTNYTHINQIRPH
jgi:hypothetical protein